MSVESVRRWMHQVDIDDGIKAGLTTAEQDELVLLRREKRRPRGLGRLTPVEFTAEPRRERSVSLRVRRTAFPNPAVQSL